MMTITQVGQKFGLTARTLRFWEQKDLLHPFKKGEQRFYPDEAVSEIETIISLKALGIELSPMWAVVNGNRTVEAMIPDLIAKATETRDEAQAKLDAIAAWVGQ